jgi:hypothetical protein
MLASPDCGGLYIALCFLVLGGQRTTTARRGDRRTQVLVLNCYLRGNSQMKSRAEYIVVYQQEVLGAFQFLSNGSE